MVKYICKAELLCRAPEAITTLLTGYTTNKIKILLKIEADIFTIM